MPPYCSTGEYLTSAFDAIDEVAGIVTETASPKSPAAGIA